MIRSMETNRAYRTGWDRIFGKVLEKNVCKHSRGRLCIPNKYIKSMRLNSNTVYLFKTKRGLEVSPFSSLPNYKNCETRLTVDKDSNVRVSNTTLINSNISHITPVVYLSGTRVVISN